MFGIFPVTPNQQTYHNTYKKSPGYFSFLVIRIRFLLRGFFIAVFFRVLLWGRIRRCFLKLLFPLIVAPMTSFPDGLDRQNSDNNADQLGANVCVKIVYQFVYSQLKGLLGIKVAEDADRHANKEQNEG